MSTIEADECWPWRYAGTVALGRGVADAPGWLGCCRIELGRSASLPCNSAIASSDTRIARPIAVARCGRRRLIAATTSVLSVVGDWTIEASPENETTPIFTLS